ncbi:MAG: ABC transporter permease [Actinomycetes bacterium]|jgi:teichoic acid transport system permease protein
MPSPRENFAPRIQVFAPHKASLPPLGPYLREFWRRRAFAIELSRFADKAEYLDSKLGKVWLVMNPLLLAMVYFLLVTVIRGSASKTSGLSTLAHILIELFTFYFASNCINGGALSITAGGRLILNQAFPRALLPLSSTISAFWQFLPTIPVYIFVVIIGKIFFPHTEIPGLGFNYLWAPFIILCVGMTGFGLALIFATMNVYFRDTNKLLSYMTRIWLYSSPVLWRPEILHGWQKIFLYVNPLGPTLSATSSVWISGKSPSLYELLGCLFWAIFAILIGGYFFVSRERDFAVRI